MPASAKGGLEDVVAGRTAICEVIGGDREQGLPGKLSYRGFDIDDLAQYSTFEETAYLLWNGELPTGDQIQTLNAELHRHRPLSDQVIAFMRQFPSTSTPMDVLRTIVSALALWDLDVNDHSPQASQRKALRLTAQFPTIITTWHRLRAHQEPVIPQPGQSTAESFLYMLTGDRPDEIAARALDVALILHADHEFNASTFAARVTAATLADVYSAITSAISALKGPLHGGANEGVIRMLQEIGEPANVKPFIEKALADRSQRVMGFGHRVYKGPDPRAVHLREMSRRLGERQGDLTYWEMSRQIEEIMQREKQLNANVDFYSASTYYALGIPTDLYTPIFAVSRIAGWTAHVLEQYADNRLIRPVAEYVGKRDQRYVPIEQRV